VGNFFKDLGKNVSRIWDDIEDEAKRLPKNIAKYGEYIGPVVTVIPGIGPIAGPLITTAGTLGKGFMGGDNVLQYDPSYSVGSTPLGYAVTPAGTGGYQFGGGQPVLPGFIPPAGGDWFQKYKTEILVGAALVVAIIVIR